MLWKNRPLAPRENSFGTKHQFLGAKMLPLFQFRTLVLLYRQIWSKNRSFFLYFSRCHDGLFCKRGECWVLPTRLIAFAELGRVLLEGDGGDVMKCSPTEITKVSLDSDVQIVAFFWCFVRMVSGLLYYLYDVWTFDGPFGGIFWDFQDPNVPMGIGNTSSHRRRFVKEPKWGGVTYKNWGTLP